MHTMLPLVNGARPQAGRQEMASVKMYRIGDKDCTRAELIRRRDADGLYWLLTETSPRFGQVYFSAHLCRHTSKGNYEWLSYRQGGAHFPTRDEAVAHIESRC